MPILERQGGVTAPMTKHFPKINGGQCAYHGTVNPLLPATEQYKLCGCFKSMGNVECSYCPESKDPEETMRISTMQVMIHPDDLYKPEQSQRVIAVCNSFECSDKHLKRFKVSL